MQVQWWCSASGERWSWAWQAYPGVWAIAALLIALYWRFTRGADRVTPRPGSRARYVAGWAGVLMIWLSLDWPIGALGTGYVASAHALQFVLIALAAPPLILRGIAPSVEAGWREGSAAARVIGVLTQPMIAATLFNLVTIGTHVPRVVDALMRTQIGAFAIDISWLLAGLVFWWPIAVHAPVRRHFPPPLQVLYIFLGTIVHTGIAIVMLMAKFPMYGIYELAPPTGWFSPIDDLEVAGGIMELGGAVIVFGIMTVLFFRWASKEGR
jgi:cytochrome c oxidase assembly factor CtaG